MLFTISRCLKPPGNGWFWFVLGNVSKTILNRRVGKHDNDNDELAFCWCRVLPDTDSQTH